MTKKQYRNKIVRLKDRIGEMQEQVVRYEREEKLLDAEDSKKLLEKYHIQSEELAELIFRREQENKKLMARQDTVEPSPGKKPDVKADAGTVAEPKPGMGAAPTAREQPKPRIVRKTEQATVPKDADMEIKTALREYSKTDIEPEKIGDAAGDSAVTETEMKKADPLAIFRQTGGTE
ncbi:MAG: hypothetical protein IJT96_08745 [Lachnospiraceae bacterium]|nr:hypothetical protein [Lachnospiraceae bacterium]